MKNAYHEGLSLEADSGKAVFGHLCWPLCYRENAAGDLPNPIRRVVPSTTRRDPSLFGLYALQTFTDE